MVLQTGEFLLETPQQRLYNPKPRTYKYNIKNSNQRLVQMEKVCWYMIDRQYQKHEYYNIAKLP